MALVTVWLGPWALVAGALLLLHPRARDHARTALTGRAVAGLLVGVLALVGVLLAVPPGWLPVPSGPGVLVGPSYLGSAVDPVDAGAPGGPVGDRVEVRSAAYRLGGCGPVVRAGARLAAVCAGPLGRRLHLVDPTDLRPTAGVRLHGGATCGTCLAASADRVVVADGRRLRTYAVRQGRLRPGRTVVVGAVAALRVERGRVRVLSPSGRLALVDPRSGAVRTSGRLPTGTPDGAASALLPGGRVATATATDGGVTLRLHTASGRRTCAVRVRSGGDPAGAPVGVSGGVLVATTRGVTRVDDRCRVRWRSARLHAASAPVASARSGLAYVTERRLGWAGVEAWYLTALDLRTGSREFARRTGTGPLFHPTVPPPALGPGGAAYLGVRAGLVRVRDRPTG